MRRLAALFALPLVLFAAACSGGASGGGSAGGAAGAGDAAAGKTFFTSSACPSCHTLTGVPNATGQIGPKLDGIGTSGATRKSGMSAEAYIRESLVDPQAFIAPGFSAPSPMPAGQATGKDLDNLVAFLSAQK
jgi:cytochrome c2